MLGNFWLLEQLFAVLATSSNVYLSKQTLSKTQVYSTYQARKSQRCHRKLQVMQISLIISRVPFFAYTDLEICSFVTVKDLSYYCLLISNDRTLFYKLWPEKSFFFKRNASTLARRRKYDLHRGSCLENYPKEQLEYEELLRVHYSVDFSN